MNQRRPDHAVMLLCTTAEQFNASSQQHPAKIEFPASAEVRVNGMILSHSFRGTKKHPGRVPPPDLNESVNFYRTKAINKIDFWYTGATKDYILSVAFAEKVAVESLVKTLKTKVLSKEAIIAKMKVKAEDDEVVSGAASISLKDPLSLRKLVAPARSSKCDHLQCFDPESFLRSNEQVPSWMCPVCSNSVKWTDVIIDGYVKNIIETVGSDVDTVIVEPTGEWKVPGNGPSIDLSSVKVNANGKAREILGEGGDDSVVLLSDDGTSPPRSKRIGALQTQSAGGSGSSTPRAIPAVIDLTADTDDEDAEFRTFDEVDLGNLSEGEAPQTVTPLMKRAAPSLEDARSVKRSKSLVSEDVDVTSATAGDAQAPAADTTNHADQSSQRSARLADGTEVALEIIDRFFPSDAASPA